MGLIKALTGAAGGVLADQWKEYFYCEALDADTLVAKGKKGKKGKKPAAKKGKKPVAKKPVKERMMTQFWQLDDAPVESKQYWINSRAYLTEDERDKK